MSNIVVSIVAMLVGLGAPCYALADPIPGLYNTGVNAAGQPLADGQPEIHYKVNGTQGTTYQHPAWYPASDAHWIAAQPGGYFEINPGKYVLTFDLTVSTPAPP